MHSFTLRTIFLLIIVIVITPVFAADKDKAFQHWTTSNGVGVYFYPSNALPMVDLRMVYAAGSARDPEKSGVAEMTSALIGSGSAGQDANMIADRLESVGSQFNAGALRDMAWISLRSLTLPEMLDESVDVMANILGKPDFPKQELELIRSQMLTGLKNEAQDPGEIAQKSFFKAVYGDHPYGRTPEADDIGAITQDDVNAFFKQMYVTGNAQLSIVGDLDRKAAESLAERLVRFMPRGDKAPKLPPVADLTEAKTIVVEHPSAQSHILIGQPGVARGADNHFALYIANHGFGGSGFASTLMGEVREKRGLAYSVYSYFSPMEEKGPFLIGLQTRNDQVEEALDVVRENLQEFIESGPDDDAFQASIQNITGGSALKTDTNAKIAQYASLVGFYDLPLNYLDVFNGLIGEETRDSVHQAFREAIDSQKLVTVIVGGKP